MAATGQVATSQLRGCGLLVRPLAPLSTSRSTRPRQPTRRIFGYWCSDGGSTLSRVRPATCIYRACRLANRESQYVLVVHSSACGHGLCRQCSHNNILRHSTKSACHQYDTALRGSPCHGPPFKSMRPTVADADLRTFTIVQGALVNTPNTDLLGDCARLLALARRVKAAERGDIGRWGARRYAGPSCEVCCWL